MGEGERVKESKVKLFEKRHVNRVDQRRRKICQSDRKSSGGRLAKVGTLVGETRRLVLELPVGGRRLECG